jgi:hypothetical protein
LLLGTFRPYPGRYRMALKQLNLKLDPAVVADWKRRADKENLSIRDWLLALTGLAAPAVPAPDLADRLQSLEQSVEALQAAVAALQQSPAPRARSSRPQPAEATARPAAALLDPPAGTLTTRELAAATGTSAEAWNNWASRNAVGAVRHHPVAGAWRLAGKVHPEGGGPQRWAWTQAAE